MHVRETSNAYDRTEYVLSLVLTERIARSCPFIATIITISYHVIEIYMKYSYHRNITMKNI